ncbi:unnamed protein product [Withania somnifera]
MGSQILKISHFASSTTLIFNANLFFRFQAKRNFAICGHPKTQFRFSSGFVPSSKRGFRSGVVAMAAPGSVQKSEEDWRAILSPEQFRILRQKGTEYPGTGEYDKFFGKGVYQCAGCGTPLYKSTTKFNSGCGWPAFFEGLPEAINRGHVRRSQDSCKNCVRRLGEVSCFDDVAPVM